MSDWTCTEVEEQLDLLAVGECDVQARALVEQHVASGSGCAAKYAESRRWMGLLSLQLDTAGPLRLRRRLERESFRRQRRPSTLPLVRRFAAVAALLLLSAGLMLALPRVSRDAGGLQLAVVLQQNGPVVRGSGEAMVPAPPEHELMAKGAKEIGRASRRGRVEISVGGGS